MFPVLEDFLALHRLRPSPKVLSSMAMPASSASMTLVVIMRTELCMAVRRTSRMGESGIRTVSTDFAPGPSGDSQAASADITPAAVSASKALRRLSLFLTVSGHYWSVQTLIRNELRHVSDYR